MNQDISSTPLQLIPLLWMLFAGVFLATVFFGSLWWSVRLGMRSKKPAVWFFASMVLRMALLLAAIYWLAGDHWARLLFCMLGFMLARLLIIRLARHGSEHKMLTPSQLYEASDHASESR